MPEGATIDDDGFLLSRDIILNDGTHGAGTGTGIDDCPSTRAVNQIQQNLLGLFIDLRKRIGAHIQERAGADFHDGRVNITRENIGSHARMVISLQK